MNIYGQALTASEVLQSYQAADQAAGGIADAPPSVAISTPAAGGSVQGTFTATVAAADDVGVAGVQFLLDGVGVGGEDTSPPFTATIDTYRYPEGLHTLTAVARDTSGNFATSPGSSVVFDNIAILPMGDSLTYGYVDDGNPDNEVGGYRRYLWERLRGDGITNVNFVGSQANGISTIDRDHEGHGGWRIDDMEAAAGGWLNASQPDIILLFAGANDIIQGYSTSLALSRMSLLLDKIHTFRPSARVIVANQPGARANQDSTFSNVTPAAISAFNSGLVPLINNRAAQGWNISLIDAFGSAGIDRSAASPDYSIDGMHLSLAGYNKLANLWYSALNLGAADAAAPSVPSGLTATPVSASQVNLAWSPSTDNVGVTGYQVFRNGASIATTPATSYQDSGLASNTTYSYSVLAYDAANNQSSPSAAASAVTGSAPRITAFGWDVNFPAPWTVPITFTAHASGGASLEYRFLTYSTATGWVVRQEYSGANAVTWFPPQGDNAVQVWVRAVGSSSAYQDWSGTGVFSVVSSRAQVDRPRVERAVPGIAGDDPDMDGRRFGGRRNAGVQIPALRHGRECLVRPEGLVHQQPGELDAGRVEQRLAVPSGVGENRRVGRGVGRLARNGLLPRDRSHRAGADAESLDERAEGRRSHHMDRHRHRPGILGVSVHHVRRNELESDAAVLLGSDVLLVSTSQYVCRAGVDSRGRLACLLGALSGRQLRRESLTLVPRFVGG